MNRREVTLMVPRIVEVPMEIQEAVTGYHIDFQGPISRGADCILLMKGDATRGAIDKLIEMLSLMRDTYPETASEPTAVEQNAAPDRKLPRRVS